MALAVDSDDSQQVLAATLTGGTPSACCSANIRKDVGALCGMAMQWLGHWTCDTKCAGSTPAVLLLGSNLGQGVYIHTSASVHQAV